MMRTAFVLLVLSLLRDASADSPLDWIRNYDLNDYAFGVAVAVSQNEYAGAGATGYAYPYLTSFRHSAFTKDWLLLKDGNLGIRYVTESNWEFGMLGRLQTISPGDSDLGGIGDRGWNVEAGALAGWRGRRLHVQSRTYRALTNTHPGTASELEFSFPFEYSRGYVVPSATLSYMSASYAGHYYGISESEASAGRPAYEPGAAVNYGVAFTLGYRLTDRWLLKTTVGVEYFDDAIVQSPIVDRDIAWSGSVGLAYNANIFQPKDIVGEADDGTVRIRAGAYRSTMSTDVRRDSPDGDRGSNTAFEDLLDTDDGETILQAEVIYRPGYFHRLKASFFDVDRSIRGELQQDFAFGDELFAAGTEIDAAFENRRLGFFYGYSLMRDSQKELGVQGGLTFTRAELEVTAEATGQSERAYINTPLPTVGLYGSLALGRSSELGLDLGVFALEFDRYRGYSGHASLTLERRVGNAVAIGIGYDYYVTRVEADDDDLRGLLRVRNAGPKLYLSWNY